MPTLLHSLAVVEAYICLKAIPLRFVSFAHSFTAAAVIWRPLKQSSDGSFAYNDTLFVMGGFGGWPKDDSRYDGMRCRNDVYQSKDGGERRFS